VITVESRNEKASASIAPTCLPKRPITATCTAPGDPGGEGEHGGGLHTTTLYAQPLPSRVEEAP
jgi:hypothetical protein